MTPDTLCIEDALTLRLFIAQGNDSLRVAPIGFGVIGLAQCIGRNSRPFCPTSKRKASRKRKDKQKSAILHGRACPFAVPSLMRATCAEPCDLPGTRRVSK